MRKTQSPRHRQQRLLPCPRWHLTPPRPKRKIRGCLRRDGRGLHFPCFRIPATTKERIDFGIYNWGFARTCYQKFFFCCTILLLRRKIPLEETAVGFFFSVCIFFRPCRQTKSCGTDFDKDWYARRLSGAIPRDSCVVRLSTFSPCVIFTLHLYFSLLNIIASRTRAGFVIRIFGYSFPSPLAGVFSTTKQKDTGEGRRVRSM